MADVKWQGDWLSYVEHASFLDEVEALEQGYLFEANRRFFHPLGLHLAGQCCDRGLRLRLLDWRVRSEGLVYEADPDLALVRLRRIERVRREWVEKAPARLSRFGFVVQPAEALRDGRLPYAIYGPSWRRHDGHDA